MISLGEQPHDPVGCHHHGQPHLGPCDSDPVRRCHSQRCENFRNPEGSYSRQDCPEEHYENSIGPFFRGRVHVLTEKCSTCIFRPGNLMHLSAGRVKNMVDGCVTDGGAIPCHKTLDGLRSVCKGFYDGYKNDIPALRLAEILGIIEYTELEP